MWGRSSTSQKATAEMSEIDDLRQQLERLKQQLAERNGGAHAARGGREPVVEAAVVMPGHQGRYTDCGVFASGDCSRYKLGAPRLHDKGGIVSLAPGRDGGWQAAPIAPNHNLVYKQEGHYYDELAALQNLDRGGSPKQPLGQDGLVVVRGHVKRVNGQGAPLQEAVLIKYPDGRTSVHAPGMPRSSGRTRDIATGAAGGLCVAFMCTIS